MCILFQILLNLGRERGVRRRALRRDTAQPTGRGLDVGGIVGGKDRDVGIALLCRESVHILDSSTGDRELCLDLARIVDRNRELQALDRELDRIEGVARESIRYGWSEQPTQHQNNHRSDQR